MEATKKLYDQDAYAAAFEADVISCAKKSSTGERLFEVILNQTLFFPEEGGQSPDMGTLGGAEVLDVQIKDGVIIHTVSSELAVGSHVAGTIDARHRFFNMQQHSGEHIFSGLVHKRFGYENVGFHLSDQVVTMDFNGALGEKEIAAVEYAANEAIAANIPIEVSFPSKEALKDMEYRSKIEIEGQVRIVTIPGYDVCACCAPHVKRTGEIGMLKVMNVESYKGGVRVSILCGFRALLAFGEKSQVLSALSAKLSANQEGLCEAVDKLKNTNQSLKSKLAAANEEKMKQRLSQIKAEEKDAVLFFDELDTPAMRGGVNELVKKHSGICGIFAGSDEAGYSFILGSTTIDCKTLAASLREKLSARGGGSEKMIQGSVTAGKEEILQALPLSQVG